MSRLDELIEKLCPDGAEFLTLQECTQKVKNIKWKSYSGNDKKYIDLSSVDRDLHCIMETQNINSDSAPSRAQQIVQTDDILLGTTRPMLKRYCMIPETYDNEICSTGFCVLRANTEIVLPKWIYHNIATTDFFAYVEQNQKGASYPAISDASVKAFSLPVPPLEVQREIVHILDSFTLLTAELTAELTARKKQYEYYRDNILTFDTTIKHVRLGDICSVITKGTTPKSYTKTGVSFVKTEAFDGAKIIPNKLSYVDEETHTTFLKRSMLEENDILITIAGATIGKCAIVPKEILPANTNQALAIIRLAKGNSPKYVMYLLQSDLMKRHMQKNIKGSAQPNLNLKQLNDFIIPLPPLNVQERLVRVLDNFEAICTDLNIGLPAEIEARQKQYEYYRDLLLTFAETGSTLMTDRQTDRQTELSAIKLIQYVFGYAMLPLGKVANVFRGEYITKKNTKEGTIPVILGGQEPAYYIDKYNHDGEIVVVARSGASAGFVSYWNQKIFVTDGFGYEEKSELIATKFLYYVLKNMESELNAMKRGAGVPHVSGEMLNSIELPIPSLQDQQRIVEILDRFDTLCNDLSSGLPAEIEARQKQYEYYRDKLLSFKELPK